MVYNTIKNIGKKIWQGTVIVPMIIGTIMYSTQAKADHVTDMVRSTVGTQYEQQIRESVNNTFAYQKSKTTEGQSLADKIEEMENFMDKEVYKGQIGLKDHAASKALRYTGELSDQMKGTVEGCKILEAKRALEQMGSHNYHKTLIDAVESAIDKYYGDNNGSLSTIEQDKFLKNAQKYTAIKEMLSFGFAK